MATGTGTNGGDPAERQKGQMLSEYALVLAFIFVVCILSVGALAVVVSGEWQSFADLFPK